MVMPKEITKEAERLFWDWVNKTYGWWDASQIRYQMGAKLPVGGLFQRRIDPENETFQYWQTYIQPQQPVEEPSPITEELFPTELTPEEEYLLNVDEFLQREVKAARLSFEDYTSQINDAIRELDIQGLNPNLPFFQEAANLPPRELVKGLEKFREVGETQRAEQEQQVLRGRREQDVFEAHRATGTGLIEFQKKTPFERLAPQRLARRPEIRVSLQKRREQRKERRLARQLQDKPTKKFQPLAK